MKRFILWVCALSIPLIMIAWFVVTFLFYVVTLVTEPASVQELEAIKRIINYVLGFL
ncbi:hypothetical protein GW750_07480 [bacterium]|nr:hypothetical protein [bacterium]